MMWTFAVGFRGFSFLSLDNRRNSRLLFPDRLSKLIDLKGTL